MNQETLWQEINDLEDAMNDEESHYGKTPAWRMMKTEHSKLWKQATADGEPAQPERRVVEIPYLSGDFYTTKRVALDWVCPVCGGKRGDVYRTQSYDGSLRVNCDGWQNPCGHIDRYEDVLKEALATIEAQQHAETTPDTPAQVDTFLFGKDVDCKQLQAHELHESDGTALEDKDTRIRQLEAENERLFTQVGTLIVQVDEIQKLDERKREIIEAIKQKAVEAAERNEVLEALLHEAAQMIAPIVEAVARDTDLMKARDGAGLFIRNSDGDRFVPIETDDDELHVRQLRAIADFAARLDAALKK